MGNYDLGSKEDKFCLRLSRPAREEQFFCFYFLLIESLDLSKTLSTD